MAHIYYTPSGAAVVVITPPRAGVRSVNLIFLNGSWIISRLPKQSRSILRHCDCFWQPFIASL